MRRKYRVCNVTRRPASLQTYVSTSHSSSCYTELKAVTGFPLMRDSSCRFPLQLENGQTVERTVAQYFRGEVQSAAQVPPPALPAGGPGAETHLPAPGGKDPWCLYDSGQVELGSWVIKLLTVIQSRWLPGYFQTRLSGGQVHKLDYLARLKLDQLSSSHPGVQHRSWTALHQETNG